MKLTNKTRWRYNPDLATRRNIEKIKRRDEWVAIIRNTVPRGPLDYLELGCAPGQYTAALAEGTEWRVSGIDYSDDAELFIETLDLVGKAATLHKFDLFEDQIADSFDIVSSFGLVEHFRGSMLDRVFELHDAYTREGGYVVIEVPNFTGIHYLWHYLFDRPDMDRHNLDAMQPAALDWFRQRDYEIVFNDYVGILRLWGNSGWLKYRLVGKSVAAVAVGLSKLALVLSKAGLKLTGRTFSPALLFVARKPRVSAGHKS